MARYLSPDWFDQIDALGEAADGPADLVLQQVVTGGPDGEVQYRIEVRGARATLTRRTWGDADMTFTSNYRTASAIACGELSTQAALLEGRIRVAGNPVGLVDRHGPLDGLDPIPAAVRADTSYA